VHYCGLHDVTSYRHDDGCPECEREAELSGVPRTQSQLYDRLQELFGIAHDDPEQPAYKNRMAGIAKLKILMGRRRLGVAQVWMVAVYCAQHRDLVVRSVEELLSHYDVANKAETELARADAETRFQNRLSKALDREVDPDEAAVLMRAVGDPEIRERVLSEWEKKHG
jgi:hypothetical protein